MKRCGIKKLTFLEAVQRLKTSNKPVMVQFRADWCGACQEATPQIEQAACSVEKNPDMDIVAIDVDTAPMIAQEFGVENLPTVAIIQQGQIKAKVEGGQTAAFYKRMARQWLKDNGYNG